MIAHLIPIAAGAVVLVGAAVVVGRLLERAGAVHELMERNPPTQRRQQ